jgi:hypothetical protein
MNALIHFIVVLSACAQAFSAAPSPTDAKKPPQALARLEFNPGGGPWSGETPFQGASWSALEPGPGNDVMMMARAGLGDEFPVQTKAKETLFKVVLENGTDDHLILVITSDEGEQKVKVTRNKPAEVTVAGQKYDLAFPTQRVSAAVGERPSTNKATIWVIRKK